MRKRFGILLAMLFSGILGVFVWGVLLPREPSYQGKRLSAWLSNWTKSCPRKLLGNEWSSGDSVIQQDWNECHSSSAADA